MVHIKLDAPQQFGSLHQAVEEGWSCYATPTFDPYTIGTAQRDRTFRLLQQQGMQAHTDPYRLQIAEEVAMTVAAAVMSARMFTHSSRLDDHPAGVRLLMLHPDAFADGSFADLDSYYAETIGADGVNAVARAVLHDLEFDVGEVRRVREVHRNLTLKQGSIDNVLGYAGAFGRMPFKE